MNDTEFKALLAQVDMTDAAQFEELCRHMARIARRVTENSGDRAWGKAAQSLNDAAEFVAQRSGE